MRATQHFHHGLLLSTPKEKKRNKTIYMGKLPTSKNKNEKSFWVFFLIITTTGMGSKLARSYNYFFCFFLRFFRHTRRKREKENKLAWIVQ